MRALAVLWLAVLTAATALVLAAPAPPRAEVWHPKWEPTAWMLAVRGDGGPVVAEVWLDDDREAVQWGWKVVRHGKRPLGWGVKGGWEKTPAAAKQAAERAVEEMRRG